MYVQRILKDNPSGFWTFTAGSGTDTSSGYINSSGVRTLNTATITSGTSSRILPLCAGLTNSILATSISIPNVYKTFYLGTENSTISIEFWNAFDSTQSHSILSVNSNITFSMTDNLAKLSITGSDNTVYTSYLEIPTIDEKIHTCLVYKNRKFFFYSNGMKSSVVNLPSSFKFKDTSAQNIVFYPTDYLLGPVSIYTYELSEYQISEHIKSSNYENDPYKHAISSDGSIYRSSGQTGVTDKEVLFDTDSEWKYGLLKNLILNSGSLSTRFIPSAEIYSETEDGGISYSTQSSKTGIYPSTTSSSVLVKDFHKYFSSGNNILTAQIYHTTTSSRRGFLHLKGLSFGSLVLERTSSGIIRLFSPEDTSIAISATTESSSSGWKDIRIWFSGGYVYFYVSGNTYSASTTSGDTSVLDSNLYIGNYYEISGATKNYYPLTSSNPIRYVSVFDISDSVNNESVGELTLKLSSDLAVSQYGEWKTLLPLQLVDDSMSIVGSLVEWNQSSSNAKVYVSSDNQNWTQLTITGAHIPVSILTSSGAPVYFKITIETSNSEFNQNKIDYLSIKTFKSLDGNSDGPRFNISPESTSPGYSPRNKYTSITSRSKNLGIDLRDTSSERPPSLHVNIPSGLTYRIVEFWFRVNSTPASGTEHDIWSDTDTSKHVYYTDTLSLYTHPTTGSVWTAQYINGQSFSNGSITLRVGGIYHFMGVLPTNYTESFAMNSRYDYASASAYDSDLSLGDIAVYPYTSSHAAFAAKRYAMYLGNNYSLVSDTSSGIIEDSVSVYPGNWIAVNAAV